MEIIDIMVTIGSVIFGGIITWFVAKWYYVKAGNELICEAKELRKLLSCIILLQQDEKGQYTPKIDANGNLITIIGHMSAKIEGSSELIASIKNSKK